MCSIAGAPTRRIDDILKNMKHRAPDGSGTSEIRPDYSLGMGLLSITGKMFQCPFTYEELTLVFNGEIYNYKELREELLGYGHTFHTDTDTEVLIHAYAEWGMDCLDRLNGMFAFAIYDSMEETLFFARDIAGEKPFYYQKRAPGFVFASELKALSFQATELLPASAGRYNFKTDKLEVWSWWMCTPDEKNTRGWTLETAVDKLDRLLEDAIRIRIPTKPYFLYRSGGVDSTLIASYLPPHDTLTYEDGDYAEAFKENIKKIVWHLDAPIDSFSSFPLWQLAEIAKAKGAKVVISGEGADELFEGYVRYAPNAMMLEGQETFPSYTSLFPYDPKMGYKDFMGKMRGLLRMGDRMAAAHGIENRCPFLDRRIIEFAFSLPPHLRAKGSELKIVLKALLKRRVPEYVFQEKHGLFASVNKWIGADDRLGKSEYLKLQWKIYQEFQ